MSSIGITSSLAGLSRASDPVQTAKAAPKILTAASEESGATLKPDSVKLSIAGQVKLLHLEGRSPALIASSLGIKAADVDSYLGIKAAPAAATTPGASNPISQPAAASTQEANPTAGSTPEVQPVASKTQLREG